MRRLLLSLAVALVPLVALFATSSVRADLTSPSPVFMPVPTPLTLRPLFGEPTGLSSGLAPGLAVMPLRLSLLASAFPLAGTMPGDPFGCASREDASGNSQAGFPVEHQIYLAMTSRLALHGFSRLGCPVDSIVGGGVTYSVPVAPNLWLVPSAGAYARPSMARANVASTGTVRVDLLMHTSGDRTLGIGLGRQGTRQGVTLTGTW